MKVGIVSYNTLFQRVGGLQNQILQTIQELNLLGVEAILFEDQKHKIIDFDLIHVFGLAHANYLWVRESHRLGIPVVISTVFQPNFSFFEKQKITISNIITKFILAGLPGKSVFSTSESSVEALNKATYIIAQTLKEKNSLISVFGKDLENKIGIVTNGIHSCFFDIALRGNRKKSNKVFVPGAIYPHKNQLAIVEATKHLGVELCLAGEILDQNYFESIFCNEYSHVKYLGALKSNSNEIIDAYDNSFVSVLYSKGETFGLVAIESLARGVPVIITDKTGLEIDGLGDFIQKIKLNSPVVLKEKVLWAQGGDFTKAELRSSVQAFTWANVANSLLKIYNNAVN